MPTYEYRCPKGHQFEVFQKMSDPPTAKCPECGKPGERLISAGAGFLLKGEGFYITDYRSEDYKKKAAAELPGEAKPAAKTDSSTSGAKESSTSGAKETKAEKSAGKGEGQPEGKKEPKPRKESKRSAGGEG